MHNLRNHASLPHRETSRKAVWRHNQLPEVSLVYFARSTSNVCCGYSETMLCVFPACFAKWFSHGCYEVWDHQMTLTMSRQLLTEECHRNDLMTCTAENSEKVYPLQGFTVLLSFYINMWRFQSDLSSSTCWRRQVVGQSHSCELILNVISSNLDSEFTKSGYSSKLDLLH